MKTPQDFLATVATARNAFNDGRTKTFEFRQKQLQGLLRLYQENTTAMIEALADDLRKSKTEAVATEVDYIKNDTLNLIYNLKSWMAPEKPSKGLPNIMDGVEIHPEPYGVVLIIGAWNYPLQLIFAPLAAAIAAGNCVIIKPSEISPTSAKLVSELLPKYLDKEAYQVYNGGISETTELLKHKFDFIFYTGSSSVGKIVHQAAAKYLTPTVLELGGKSPVYLDASADVNIAAARIMWGKCLNSGQSCIAPDYLLCSKEVEEKFIVAAKKCLAQWYGDKIKQTTDYGRIVNMHHFERVQKLLKGQKIAYGGDFDASQRYIQPTIVTDVQANSPIMEEEIFGPVLPIFNVKSAAEAVQFINNREKPLALYVFSSKSEHKNLFLQQTASGNVLINDTLMHFSCDSLPFGGVGNSGMGSYHGKFGFDVFSHKKGVLIKDLSGLGELLQSPRYPPFSDNKLMYISMMTKKYPNFIGQKYLTHILVFALGVGISFANKFLFSQYDNKN